MTEILLREQTDGVVLLTLNRPDKRNALSRDLRAAIVEALRELDQDDSTGAVVLTGAGHVFCAGFDRDEFAGGGMAKVFADATAYHRSVHTFGKPLVAAVNGAALGGGCDLAAMCDLRVASEQAVFGQPQVRFGAPAAYELMESVMGAGVAREMCLTGRPFTAAEALAAGLVNRVVNADALAAAARELAAAIAALPPGMPRTLKQTFVAAQPPLFGE